MEDTAEKTEAMDGRMEVMDGKMEVTEGKMEDMAGRMEAMAGRTEVTDEIAGLGSIEIIASTADGQCRILDTTVIGTLFLST